MTKPEPGKPATYDFLIFIGRFQPFHNGHLAVVREGLRQAGQLIVLCGSAHQPRSTRNPWSFQERETMIRGALDTEENRRLHVAPLMDNVYNDEIWVRNVQATVNGIVTAHYRFPHKPPRVGLVGHSKDHSSYYLNLFPQWGSMDVPNHDYLNATGIREKYFCAGSAWVRGDEAQKVLPVNVRQMMDHFSGSEIYADVRGEQEFVVKYKSAWADAPYAPTFVTVDALVVQSGHVLLVERKARPGAGLLALPGGFVNQNEKLIDACIRELREETRLKVPEPVLKGSLKEQQVFDDPYRSARGRTITHAFYIELSPNSELPRVKGSDDAKYAMWVPLADLDPSKLFEDHYFIIQEMTGL